MSQASSNSIRRQSESPGPRHVLTRRYWEVIWNNPPSDWKEALRSFKADFALGQLEQGSQGTPHIQALLWFRDRIPAAYWKGRPCWSRAVYSDEVDTKIAYVSKEDTRLEGPYSYGKLPNHVKKSKVARRRIRDWDRALELSKEGRIKEVEAAILIPHVSNLQKIAHLFDEPVGTTVPRGVWIYGPPGTGKSYYARTTYPNAYIKAQNKWWDGYDRHGSVLLEDFDKLGSGLFHLLKVWLDSYPFAGEIKGGTVSTHYEFFVITSNYLPSQLFDDPIVVSAIERRCKFIHFPSYRRYIIGDNFGQLPVEPQAAAFDAYISSFFDK